MLPAGRSVPESAEHGHAWEPYRSGVLPLTLEEVTETMERTVKPQFRELNRKALHIEE